MPKEARASRPAVCLGCCGIVLSGPLRAGAGSFPTMNRIRRPTVARRRAARFSEWRPLLVAVCVLALLARLVLPSAVQAATAAATSDGDWWATAFCLPSGNPAPTGESRPLSKDNIAHMVPCALCRLPDVPAFLPPPQVVMPEPATMQRVARVWHSDTPTLESSVKAALARGPPLASIFA